MTSCQFLERSKWSRLDSVHLQIAQRLVDLPALVHPIRSKILAIRCPLGACSEGKGNEAEVELETRRQREIKEEETNQRGLRK